MPHLKELQRTTLVGHHIAECAWHPMVPRHSLEEMDRSVGLLWPTGKVIGVEGSELRVCAQQPNAVAHGLQAAERVRARQPVADDGRDLGRRDHPSGGHGVLNVGHEQRVCAISSAW